MGGHTSTGYDTETNTHTTTCVSIYACTALYMYVLCTPLCMYACVAIKKFNRTLDKDWKMRRTCIGVVNVSDTSKRSVHASDFIGYHFLLHLEQLVF